MAFDVLIVEDDQNEKEALEACLDSFGQERGISFHVTWLSSALEFLEKRPLSDLIFMDIDMPGLSGMEAAESLREYDSVTPLVFVTNLAQYAVHGYAVDATDFIIKPVEYGSFALRMARVMRRLRRDDIMLSLQTRDGARLFPVTDVVYVSVSGHYLVHHLVTGEIVRSRGTIRDAEANPAFQDFVRISNNELINATHVRRMTRDSVEMDTDETLWFSRARKKEAQERIVRLMGTRI